MKNDGTTIILPATMSISEMLMLVSDLNCTVTLANNTLAMLTHSGGVITIKLDYGTLADAK